MPQPKFVDGHNVFENSFMVCKEAMHCRSANSPLFRCEHGGEHWYMGAVCLKECKRPDGVQGAYCRRIEPPR